MPDNDSAGVISKEGFMEMIKHLDRDGDGTVDKHPTYHTPKRCTNPYTERPHSIHTQ